MTSSTDTVVGVFESESQARQVVDELVRSGFTRDQVHFSSESNYTGEIASGGASLHGRTPEHHGGGFMHWLDSLFGADDADERSRYSGAISHGRFVVAVDADDARKDRVVTIMNSQGAVDIDEDARRQGYHGQTVASDTTTRKDRLSTKAKDVSTDRAIPVVREELQIGKRVVQRGAVRIFSRVVEQPVEEQVRLREEKVRVERRPVDRPITGADQAMLRDQTIEVTEMGEEPVVQKQARVVEEVRIGKDVTERTETVRDTLRHTEVNTDNIDAKGSRDYRDDFRRDFATRYGTTGEQFETYAPAYDYGYRVANDSRYRGKSWDDVEDTLRTDYLRNNPNSSWDRAKGAVRYGWEKVTGKR